MFDNNLTLRSDTVVSAWKGTTAQGLLELQVSVIHSFIYTCCRAHFLHFVLSQRITAAGQPAILTAGYYLNYGNYTSIGGVPDWVSFYETEVGRFETRLPHTLVH